MTPWIEIWSFEVRDVFVMKSSWVLNWASFGTDMFLSSSKEIYHKLLQQTRKFQWICTYSLKKKNAGKNYKNTGSGLGAKLHEQYYVSTRFHAHSQTQSPNDITESHQTNSSKIICVFSIPGTMCWKYIFTDTNSKGNSTPLLKVSLHAFSHDAHQPSP